MLVGDGAGEPGLGKFAFPVWSRADKFSGPLADLKRLADQCSHPGIRFYVSTRQTLVGTTIRIQVRDGSRRLWRSFEREFEARSFIQEFANFGQVKPTVL